MRKFLLIIAIYFFFIGINYSQTRSYFNQNFLDCIVLLEKVSGDSLLPHGTGISIYNYSDGPYSYVVTCEHVLRNKSIYVTIPAKKEFIDFMINERKNKIGFNGYEWTLKDKRVSIKVDLIIDSTYAVNPELDIGVIKLPHTSSLIYKNDTVGIAILNKITRSAMGSRKGIELGTDIYFAGYPYSIGTNIGFLGTYFFSDSIPNPVLRKGSIAWISENSPYFLLDAFSYSGNSGSPVFTTHDLQNKSLLIGIVTGHIPSINSDNMGLAKCVWIEYINELINRLE